MSDETTQAIFGDAVAASLEKPGRGLFNRKKRTKEEPARLTHCEDCGTELHGHYCSKCGQVAVDYRRSFRHVIADVAESFLNWDSKFVTTIGLLLIRPGWLTNQFVSGRRTRYLHPLRLYLLVSILFFLCARLIPVKTEPQVKADLTPEDRTKVEEAMKKAPNLPDNVRAEVNKALAEEAETSPPAEPGAAKSSGTPSAAEPSTGQSPTSTLVKKRGHSKLQFGDENGPHGPFETWMQQRVKDKIGEDGTKMQLFWETLRSNISTMMLFCIPLFAFVLKILYIRKRRFYIEHLVYALHIHSFFYIAVLLTSFSALAAQHWAPALETPLIWILAIFVLVQVFLSIRHVYRQGWFMTTFKFFFGGFIYLIVLIAALAITAVATIALP
jgi:Protein of unknown function (DUF3667)